MAFVIRDLSVLAYANGFTLWHYRTKDELRTATAPGYLGDACDMLAEGDMLMLNASDGARIVCVGWARDELVTVPLAGT